MSWERCKNLSKTCTFHLFSKNTSDQLFVDKSFTDTKFINTYQIFLKSKFIRLFIENIKNLHLVNISTHLCYQNAAPMQYKPAPFSQIHSPFYQKSAPDTLETRMNKRSSLPKCIWMFLNVVLNFLNYPFVCLKKSNQKQIKNEAKICTYRALFFFFIRSSQITSIINKSLSKTCTFRINLCTFQKTEYFRLSKTLTKYRYKPHQH